MFHTFLEPIMGHARLPPLPVSRRWRDVVALVRGGAGVQQVASATLKACEQEFLSAANDPGVVEAVWLLMRLPLAARGGDFVAELGRIGVVVPSEPTLADLVAGVSEAIDSRLPNNRGRTDLGEMAQSAAAGSLYGHLGARLNGLFDTGPEALQAELARMNTAKQFGLFAKDFFARFTARVIDYFLNRTLPEQTGAGERFRTFPQQRGFTDALDAHCREAAAILETYAGGWLKKNEWETGRDIEREHAGRFTGYAMTKLIAELRRRNAADGR